MFGANGAKEYTGVDLHFVVSIFMTFVMCNHPSNSNLNPAVTLGLCLRHTKRYQRMLFWLYCKSQFCGAFAANVLAYLLNGVYRPPLQPVLHTNQEYLQIFLSEFVSVFVLIVLILQITGPNTSYTTAKIERYLFIGIFVYLGRKFSPSSGNALNASLTFARAVFGVFFCDFEGLKYFYLWALGDLLGALLAVLFYNYLLEPHVVGMRIDKILHQER